MPTVKTKTRHMALTMLLMAGVLLGGGVLTAAEPQNVIHVDGAVAKPGDWTAARIANDLATELRPLHYESRGRKHVSKCVPLLALLKAAGVQTTLKMDPSADPKTKNMPVRLVVIVIAQDGYAAAFSLAEMLPELGRRDVWLALDVDGNPLSESDGPARLIVPGDQKPARWVRGIR